MALKLFRSTGYSSILSPGETRAGLHPGWMQALVSGWIGFACNVQLWRQLRALPADGEGLARALVMGAFVGGACLVLLSLLGWRRTFKPAATLMLLLAALAASSLWSQALPVNADLLNKPLWSVFIPSWASLLRWQVTALLVGLALVPMVWVWNTSVRRLPGPKQLAVNLAGALAGCGLLAASGLLLSRALP